MIVRRARTVALVALVVLSSAACQVHTDIGIEIKENGSGSVTVAVGLDEAALSKVPDFAEALKTSDLTAHGWTITGPEKRTDDLTYFSATKPFANPEEANQIFREIGGENGPFQGFTISRKRSFARTEFRFEGTVDFSKGLESFSDNELAQQLDGAPLGEDIKKIEEQLGSTLDAAFPIRIAVRLPGNVSSNAPLQASNGAVWQPKLSEPAPVRLEASSTSTRWFTVAGAIAVGVSIPALVVVLVLTRVRARRRASVS